MKALTLHQPWATLIAAGVKTMETRSWGPPESLIGHRIALHAGKQIIKSRNGLGAATWEMMNTLVRRVTRHRIPGLVGIDSEEISGPTDPPRSESLGGK